MLERLTPLRAYIPLKRQAMQLAGPQRWRRLLWALLFPRQDQRVVMTAPGMILVMLSIGIGMAAYNTASNILFITLSLLLSCMIMSGVLSWINFRRLDWRLEVDTPMRAGREHPVKLRIHNAKRFLPSYSLCFEVAGTSAAKPQTLNLPGRIDPKGEAELGWTVRPQRRGREKVEVRFVGSQYPFGFLNKSLAADTACEVLVWPAPVEYRRFPLAAWQRSRGGGKSVRVGQGDDLLALRDYQSGDSHRQIHWKVSARLGRLVVRQFAADTQEAFVLCVPTAAELWRDAEQFELLCSFAATLAEDLFRRERLQAVAFDDEPVTAIRGMRDLEAFLDRLAVMQPREQPAGAGVRPPARSRGRNLLTFAPEGARGIAAYVDGEKAAAA